MLEWLDQKILDVEKKFSFDPNNIYYYNAQRKQDLIIALQQRYNNFDTNHIQKIFNDSLGIDNIKDIKLNTTFGTWHVIAFIKTEDHTYVYKQTIGLPVQESYMLLEKDIVDEYKKIGINSVDILAYGSGGWFERQIMEVLPDQNAKEYNRTQEEYNQYSKEIGKIIAKQYHLSHEWWGRIVKENGILKWSKKSHYEHFTAYLDYDLDIISVSELIDETGIWLLKKHLAWEKTKKIFESTKWYLINNDLPDHNVRVNKETMKISAIYDWENAVIFDPICELGALPTWVSPYPKKQQIKEGFMSYIQEAKLENKVDLSSLDEKIALYFLRTMIRKIPMAIKGKKLSSRHIDLLNEALRDNKLEDKIRINEEVAKMLTWNR